MTVSGFVQWSESANMGGASMIQKRAVITTAILVIALVAAAMAPGERSASGAHNPQHVTLETAVEQALAEGGGAERVRLNLHDSLLEAADLQREHETGPPRAQRLTLPANEDEVSITLGAPTDFEEAKVEELLPVQFAAVRETARSMFVREMAGFRAEVIDAYYTALLARERKQVMEATIEVLQAHRDRSERLFAAGEVPEADVVQTEARLESGHGELVSAKSELDRARMELANKIGFELDAELTLEDELKRPAVETEMSLPDDLQAARALDPAVVGAQGELAAAEKEKELFTEHRGTYTGRRSYRERTLGIEEAEHELEEAGRGVEVQVRAVHSEIEEALGKLQAAERQMERAEKMEEMATVQYESGLATVTRVLDAALEAQEAQFAVQEAKVSCSMALARRDALIGEGVEGMEEEYRDILEEIEELR